MSISPDEADCNSCVTMSAYAYLALSIPSTLDSHSLIFFQSCYIAKPLIVVAVIQHVIHLSQGFFRQGSVCLMSAAESPIQWQK